MDICLRLAGQAYKQIVVSLGYEIIICSCQLGSGPRPGEWDEWQKMRHSASAKFKGGGIQ